MTAPRAYLPASVNARRDRGEGLFVARERVESPYFTCVPVGGLWRLTPTETLLREYEKEAPQSALSRTFLRFRGLPVERESLSLFCEAAKLLEAPERARLAALDKALRQRAAVCLRTGGGGGLYACATMLDFIKGE